jgi:hypothetical protein
MSKLNRMPWQMHVFADPKPEHYRIVTNTFRLEELTYDELTYATFPFIGAPGKLEIRIHDCVGTESQREALFNHISTTLKLNRRGSGFLQPLHSALHTYWYNMCSDRELYDFRALSGALKGTPVLFVGAGPSTQRDIEKIRTISEGGHAFIVTGGTGITVLHNNGIRPDLCLAVDPFDQEIERFKDIDYNDVPLLASNSLNPTCYDMWTGPLIAAQGLNCMKIGQFIEGNDIVTVDEGPVGVSTWAINLFKYMGATDIYLIGVDLCFGDKGETYAGDLDMTASAFHYEEYGDKKTKGNWILEGEYLGGKIKEHGYRAYNASEGLNIPNTKHVDLSVLFKKPHHGNPDILKPYVRNVKAKLCEFITHLERAAEDLTAPDLDTNPAYVYLVKQYDDIQEYQYWRTGTYNYSLIREVIRTSIETIQQALKGEHFPGDSKVGLHGCPLNDIGKNKVKTGSQYDKESSRGTARKNGK